MSVALRSQARRFTIDHNPHPEVTAEPEAVLDIPEQHMPVAVSR